MKRLVISPEANITIQKLSRSSPAPADSVFREQVFQLRFRQASGKAFFTEHVGNSLGLALLELPDLFLDSARRNQAIRVYGLGLADPVRSIDCLGFNGRVPPGIIEHHIAGRGQVESGASSTQAQKKHRSVGVILE